MSNAAIWLASGFVVLIISAVSRGDGWTAFGLFLLIIGVVARSADRSDVEERVRKLESMMDEWRRRLTAAGYGPATSAGATATPSVPSATTAGAETPSTIAQPATALRAATEQPGDPTAPPPGSPEPPQTATPQPQGTVSSR